MKKTIRKVTLLFYCLLSYIYLIFERINFGIYAHLLLNPSISLFVYFCNFKMSESESIHEFFENLLLEENDNSVKGECDEALGPEASLGVREIRQRRRSLLKIIQDYSRRIAELNSERDVIKFEEEHVIPLDWEVRDFLKSARDLENSEGPVGLGQGWATF